jgi:hypothetical protein
MQKQIHAEHADGPGPGTGLHGRHRPTEPGEPRRCGCPCPIRVFSVHLLLHLRETLLASPRVACCRQQWHARRRPPARTPCTNSDDRPVGAGLRRGGRTPCTNSGHRPACSGLRRDGRTPCTNSGDRPACSGLWRDGRTPCTNSSRRLVRPGSRRGCKNPMHQFRGGSRLGLPAEGVAEPHAPIRATVSSARVCVVVAKPHAPIQATVLPAPVCVVGPEPHAPIQAWPRAGPGHHGKPLAEATGPGAGMTR